LQDWGYDTVIEGEARGADTIAREEAERLGFKVLRFPAQWNTYGKAAGPIRNYEMLKQGQPDLIVAFHDDISSSKGTAHMLRCAEAAGVTYTLITH